MTIHRIEVLSAEVLFDPIKLPKAEFFVWKASKGYQRMGNEMVLAPVKDFPEKAFTKWMAPLGSQKTKDVQFAEYPHTKDYWVCLVRKYQEDWEVSSFSLKYDPSDNEWCIRVKSLNDPKAIAWRKKTA